MKTVYLYKSSNPNKKWTVIVDNKTIHFGASSYDDYTTHKDVQRKKLYMARHKRSENWTKSGIKTPGFWSRWLLWNKPGLLLSLRDIENKFDVHIVRKRS
jgi:hypothetical protein